MSKKCAVLAAAVIGSFSWNTVPNAYWLASALWHCTLVFSILGILLSAQQLVVLNILDTVPDSRSPSVAEKAVKRYLPLMLSMTAQPDIEAESQPSSGGLGKWKPRWKMVFTWQCPMMFMSYSVCLFLAGLTILVCTPLIRGVVWSEGANVNISYISRTYNTTLTLDRSQSFTWLLPLPPAVHSCFALSGSTTTWTLSMMMTADWMRSRMSSNLQASRSVPDHRMICKAARSRNASRN